MGIHFVVKNTVPPPSWMDFTNYEYWKISNDLGSYDWENERWTAANENIELVPVYDWNRDFRPQDIRITHTSNAPRPDLRLYDTQNNLIATFDAIDKATPETIPITFGSYDIGKLVVVSNNSVTFRVKPIEFNSSYDPYTPTYSMEWSSTLKSSDMTIDSVNPLLAYKSVGAGNLVAKTILAETGRSSGKYYFEVRMHGNTVALTNSSMGIRQNETDSGADYEAGLGNTAGRGHAYWAQGRFYSNGSLLTQDPIYWGIANRWVTLGCAVDFALGYCWFNNDGVWTGASGDNPDPTTGTDPAITGISGTYYPAAALFYETDTYFSEAHLQASSDNIEHLPSGFLPWEGL